MDAPEQDRLAALEREVARLASEVAELRQEAARRPAQAEPGATRSDPASAPRQYLPPAVVEALRRPPGGGPESHAWSDAFTRASNAAHHAIDEQQIESVVGRYGTLALAALVILMGVGVLIEFAVARGLLTPEVRLVIGALAALVVGGAGLWFRARREVRYGDVLLALSLAIVDLVAWGAGPRLHVIPVSIALIVVDVVAFALAWLAMHDENEFLFAVAVGGALTAPFVTSNGGGTALALLSYGGVVLLGALRTVRDPGWLRAFWVLASGALLYVLAAVALPMSPLWYGPVLVVLFAAAIAAGALVFAPLVWRGWLGRAYLAAGVIGTMAGWDRVAAGPLWVTAAASVAVAGVTYAALARRDEPQPLWPASAILLPLVSLGIAWPATRGSLQEGGVVGVWAMFALVAWRFERARTELERGSLHLMTGGLLGSAAIVTALWDVPLALVAGLAAWGVALAWRAGREDYPAPLVAVACALGAAALSAFDQLASRAAYAYVPFMSRSSMSAALATAGLWLGSELLGTVGDKPAVNRWASRPLRLSLLVGFAILWGRMEFAHAFSPDLAVFLLILYYAAVGLVTILVGRRLAVSRLRLLGLGLAIYAAVKAMVEAQSITGLGLRVGAYGAVGVFLLGAGYLYRVRADEDEERRDVDREAMAAGTAFRPNPPG